MSDSKIIERFKFKDQRNYVHGTDIFNYFYQNIADYQKITLSFHQVCLNASCEIHQLCSETEVPDDKVALCKVEHDGVVNTFYIAAQTAVTERQVERVPYDESLMVSNAEIEGKEAKVVPNKSFTFIENLVALTKYFHQSYFDVSGGQWFFAQLELVAPINVQDELVLNLHKNMGARLTQSKIFQGNNEIGTIYFSYHKES